MTTKADVNEFSGTLAELVKEVQAGNEVLLTQGQKPVARIISASEKEVHAVGKLQIRSLKGHQVLTPNISTAEIMDEMFRPK